MTVDYEKYTEFVDAVTSDESKTYSAFDKRVYELEESLPVEEPVGRTRRRSSAVS